MLMITVEPIMFLFVLSFGAQMFVTQDLLFQRLCIQKFHEEKICSAYAPTSQNGDNNSSDITAFAEIERHVVFMWMLWNVTYTLISVIMGQVFGYWMDKYSKKYIALVPQVGQMLVCLGFVIISAMNNAPLWTIYILSVVGGLCGGFVVLKGACTSYLINILDENSHKTIRISMIEGAFFIGGSCGLFSIRLLIIYVTDKYDIIYLVNMGVIVLSILYTTFILPDIQLRPHATPPTADTTSSYREESYDSDRNNPFRESEDQPQSSLYPRIDNIDVPDSGAVSRRSRDGSFSTVHTSSCVEQEGRYAEVEQDSILGTITNAIRTTFRKREDGYRAMIIANIVANSFSVLLFSAELDLSYIYLKYKIGWNFSTFLQYFGIKTSCDGASLLLLLPLLRVIKISDCALGIAGGLSRAAFFIFMGIVFKKNIIYWAILINIFGFYPAVVSKSLMSKLVLENEQGRAMTVLSSWEQLGTIAGSLIFDSLYSELLKNNMPGVTMFIAAAFAGAITVIYCSLYFSLLIRSTSHNHNNNSIDERTSLLSSPPSSPLGSTKAQSLPIISISTSRD